MTQEQTTNTLTKKQRRLAKKDGQARERQELARKRVKKRWMYIVGGAVVVGVIVIVLQNQFAGSPPTASSDGTKDTDDPLKLCIQHTGVGLHIHPNLAIKIKGKYQEIPTNIGITPSCMRPIHTHDGTGEIHLEFPAVRDVRLGEFFKVWGKQFNKACIFDYCTGADGAVKMFVNGEENFEFENYVMHDLDEIEIRFE